MSNRHTIRFTLLAALLTTGCARISDAEYDARLDQDGDGMPMGQDCDDSDPTVQKYAWFVDADEDGVGGTEIIRACKQPAQTASITGDCNDNNPDVSPELPERCDNLDNDCDGDIDEDAVDRERAYRDQDQDGYGNADVWMDTCDWINSSEPTNGWVPNKLDCDDTNKAVHPEAEEICDNGRDDNCNQDLTECFFNGIHTANEASITLIGSEKKDELGSSMLWAGNMDENPGDELWVGVPGLDVERQNNGGAFLLGEMTLGQHILNLEEHTHFLTDLPDVNHDAIGTALGMLRDIDGDQKAELVVSSAPKATVWMLMSADSETTAMTSAFTISSGEDNKFGSSLSGFNDIDGDGFDELLVGAYDHDAQDTIASNRGAVALFMSSHLLAYTENEEFTLEEDNHAIYEGSLNGEKLGKNMHTAGDTDGDGIPEVLLGAAGSDSAAVNQGAIFLWEPDPSVRGIQTLIDHSESIYGNNARDEFGASIAGVGDTNGDGYADILVGAPGVNINERDDGAAYLYLGPLENTAHFDYASRITSTTALSRFGSQVVSAGDINLDGKADFAISAPHMEVDSINNVGAVYFFLGAEEHFDYDIKDAVATVFGNEKNQELGSTLTGGGDYNNDGRPDIAIGALAGGITSQASSDNNGAIYIFNGISH